MDYWHQYDRRKEYLISDRFRVEGKLRNILPLKLLHFYLESNHNHELLQAMLDYVRNSQNDEIAEAEDLQPAVGIAAVQVGVLKQMIAVVIPYEDGVDEVALVNPKIISESVQNAYNLTWPVKVLCPHLIKAIEQVHFAYEFFRLYPI